MKIWSKTLLSVYKYLESISKAIDNLVMKKSINSSFYSNCKCANAFDCANQLIELTERKLKLINLKVICEDAMCKLSSCYKRIVALCFIDGVKSSDVAKMLNISMRTLFRKKNEALNCFSKVLKNMGYDSKKLEELYGSEVWLKNVYAKNLMHEISNNKEYIATKINEYQLLKNVMNEFNALNSNFYHYV